MWKTLSSETLMDDYHVSVRKNKVELPDGAIIDDFYTVRIPDAAMVAAITTDGEILLKSEFRYAIGSEVIECPVGMFEKYESDPLIVAKRELLEETGYTASNWTYLGETLESRSWPLESLYMHLFLATGAERIGQQYLDKNEHLSVMKIKIEDAVEMVMNGKINANSTAHLILKVDRLRREYGL